MFRFIHSSDLHLGKRFGNFSGDLPSRLREARHTVLSRLAQHSHAHSAPVIMLAGDTFDTETPLPEIRRQALTEMGQHPAITWIILPGNHDSLQAAQLWSMLKNEAPENVILAVEPHPIHLGDNAVVLPAPCTTRRPGRDLTAWMDACETPEGVIRIGLAHGAIQSFSEDDNANDVIAPDRAQRAGLSYLALGDWHGAMDVNTRTRYSGTPEPDRFKHNRPGAALLVTLASAQALPEITPLPTGHFEWKTLELDGIGGQNPREQLQALMPDLKERRQTLLRITANGRCTLAERTALMEAVAHSAPDYAFLELDAGGLVTQCVVDDLDNIDRGGALRDAANALHADTENQDKPTEERDIAREALARLYSYAQEISA